jgi:hypothetical protein
MTQLTSLIKPSTFALAALISLSGCQVYVDDNHNIDNHHNDTYHPTPTSTPVIAQPIDIRINNYEDERIVAVAVAALNLALTPADLINHNNLNSEEHAQNRLEATLKTLLDDNYFSLSSRYECDDRGTQGVDIESDIGAVESFYEGRVDLNYDAVNCESGFDSSINGRFHSFSEWLTKQSTGELVSLYGETHTFGSLDFYNDDVFTSFTINNPNLNRVEKRAAYNEISTYIDTHAWVSTDNDFNNFHIQSIQPISFDSKWNSGVPIDGEILITDDFNHKLTVIFEQNLLGVLNHQNNHYNTYYLSDLRLLNHNEY